MSLTDYALRYEQMGFSVIPVNMDKKPLIPWTEYQQRRATEQEIVVWWAKYPNAQIGIVTGIVSGVCVIDIDTIEGKECVVPLLGDFVAPECYTPKSGIEDGIHYGRHLYFKCDSSVLRNNQNDESMPGVDRRANGGYVVAPPSFDGAYRWVMPLTDFQTMLQPLPYAYLEYVQKNITFSKNEQSNTLNGELFQKGRRDNDIFHIANTLTKNGEPPETVRDVCLRLASTCNPPFAERDVLKKIESALSRSNRIGFNLSQEVREWVMSSTGVFYSSAIAKCLQLSLREDLKNVSKILSRLCEEGLISRYGNKHGQFRRIEGECEPLDLTADMGDSLNIRYPFWIEKIIKTMPGNVLIVAGVPNAGKTAFFLNLSDMNMDNHDIHYFSSEMGLMEFRERIKYFKRPLPEWNSKMKFYERSDNFADVIRPNGINIIDFLEVHDEFYKVGAMIKEIFDSLHDGIAIIGLQKNPGNNTGLGGYRGLEKARLYLTMDNGCLKIEKGKNLVNPESKADGMFIHYNLTRGSNFEIIGNWRRNY